MIKLKCNDKGIIDIKTSGSMIDLSEQIASIVKYLLKYDSDFVIGILYGIADVLSHKTIIEKLDDIYKVKVCEIIDFNSVVSE